MPDAHTSSSSSSSSSFCLWYLIPSSPLFSLRLPFSTDRPFTQARDNNEKHTRHTTHQLLMLCTCLLILSDAVLCSHTHSMPSCPSLLLLLSLLLPIPFIRFPSTANLRYMYACTLLQKYPQSVFTCWGKVVPVHDTSSYWFVAKDYGLWYRVISLSFTRSMFTVHHVPPILLLSLPSVFSPLVPSYLSSDKTRNASLDLFYW